MEDKEHYKDYSKNELIDLIIGIRKSRDSFIEDNRKLKQLAYRNQDTTYKRLYEEKNEENLALFKKNIKKEYELEQELSQTKKENESNKSKLENRKNRRIL